MRRFLVFTFLAVAATASASERPTEEQVAAAVKKARQAVIEERVVTKKDVLDGINNEARQVKREIRNCKIRSRREREKFIRERMRKYEELKEEYERIARDEDYEPEQEEIAEKDIPLPEFDWDDLSTGSIGRLGRSGAVECVQVFSPTSILALYVVKRAAYYRRPEAIVKGGPPSSAPPIPLVRKAYPPVLIDGIDSDQFAEGGSTSANSLDWNLIVVGRKTYNSANGHRTVPVIELFDPNKPFK